jgi:anti-anti-sigma factor
MDSNLNIQKESLEGKDRVILEGRLDATWAGHLDDYINGLIREGVYKIQVHMAGVQYLSSAGIRVLVNQYKKISKIGGSFRLEELSQSVHDVLKMVGMLSLLTGPETEQPIEEKQKTRVLETGGYRFDCENLQSEPMISALTGTPGRVAASGYGAGDSSRIRFEANHYGLGIGAIGDGYDDCKARFGEFLALGDAVVYKPSDGSKVPDYTVRTGRLEPEIEALYAIHATGEFSERILFEPTGTGKTITLAGLMEAVKDATGSKSFIFLMIAESAGLIGVSLSVPPVGGDEVFGFPGIRSHINFTTEPAYSRMLTVTLGFYSESSGEEMKAFLRPVKPGHAGYSHVHSAVFPYQALPKNEASPGRMVRHLFETSIVEDVLHLIHDSREISGLGDSTFRQGVIWAGNIG